MSVIVRIWRGSTSAANERAYVEHLRKRVFPGLQNIRGFLGASLLKRSHADGVEFQVQTKWASMDAIHAFAGADASRAVVEPAATAVLSDYDRTVQHFEVVEEIAEAAGR